MKNLPRGLWLALLLACLCVIALPQAAEASSTLTNDPSFLLDEILEDLYFFTDSNVKYSRVGLSGAWEPYDGKAKIIRDEGRMAEWTRRA